MLFTFVLAYLAILNLLGFALMFWDKGKAKASGWRVQEKTLLGIAAIGGSIGIYAGMRFFRHKTKHLRFSLGVPAILLVQVLVICLAVRHFR